MDENRLPSEQERSEPNQGFSIPVITGVVSLAASPARPPDIRGDRLQIFGNVTTAGAARLSSSEEEANTTPIMPPDGDRVPRVRKNTSDRKYERRSHVDSQVSTAVAEIKILLPITLNSASLNVLPACFNQLQTSTDSLSQEPRILDTAPSGYQSFVRVIHSPSTESALPIIQAAQPSEQQSSMPLAPAIDTAHSIQMPAPTKSLPAQPLIAVMNTAAALTSGYSNIVHMGHPPLTGSAANLQSSTSSQQSNLCSPSPVINSACLSQRLSSSSAPNQLLEDATLPSGTPNVQMVPPSTSKNVQPGKQLVQTSQQPGSVHQEHVNNLPMSNSSLANMPQGAQGMDVGKLQAVEAANRLGQSSLIQPSVQSAVVVQTTMQGSTIQQGNGLPTGNQVHKVNVPKSKKKPHLLAAPQKADVSANQTIQRVKKYHTQVWMRNELGTPSSTQPQKARFDKSTHNEKQRSTCTHRRDVLNNSWDRIIVSSDEVSTLSLQDIRRGIETFLMSRVSQEMVFKDRMLRLHWDGKDLGTFQYKDAAASIPAITIEDEIIISSSDDEPIEVDTATPVTPVTVGKSGGVTHDPHVTVVGSQKSACKGIKDPLEPHVILAECISSDSEDCSDRDDLSDGRKAAKSSDEDPTYSPDEEEISSEDKTSPENSDTEACAKPSAGSSVDPSADNDSDASSMQDLLPVPPTENQNSTKPLGKGHKKKLTGSCGNSSAKKRQLRDQHSRTNARKQKRSDDSFDSSQSELDISSDESSSSKQRRSAKKPPRARRPQGCTAIIPKSLSRRMARVITDVSVPADIICPPCIIELFPLKDNLLHNGKVNLSVIQEQELVATDNNANTSDDTWARVANALSFAPELDIGSPW